MRISKAQAKELRAYQERLSAERHEIDVAWHELVRTLEGTAAVVNHLIEKHNLCVAAATLFVNDIANEMRDAYEEKTEGWKDGEHGARALEIVEAWEGADLNEVECVKVLLPDRPLFAESLNLPESEEDL